MKFSMSEAWRDATAMMAANREVLVVIAGIFFLLPGLITALTVPDMQDTMLADPENAQQMVIDLYAGWWWLLLLVIVVQLVGYLGMLALLRDASRPTVGEALRAGLASLLPAIGFYILCALAVMLLTVVILALAAASPALGVVAGLLCAVGVIYAMVKLSLGLAVIAIDRVSNPIAAIARSWRLTKGNSFRLFLFYLLLVIVYLVISIVVGMIVAALVLALGTSAALVVNGVLSAVLGAVLTVVFMAVIAAVHRQLSGPSAEAVSATFE